jgi:hypothetical protein
MGNMLTMMVNVLTMMVRTLTTMVTMQTMVVSMTTMTHKRHSLLADGQGFDEGRLKIASTMYVA